MAIQKKFILTFLLFSMLSLLFFVGCPTTEAGGQVLNMKIDKDNDSLLTFDSLIVKVYSKDGTFSQDVFHGVLRNPKQVMGMPLDARVGKEYKITIVGYKTGRVAVNKEVTILGSNDFVSKDILIPIKKFEDTVTIPNNILEIECSSDTVVSEGDSVYIPIRIVNPSKIDFRLTANSLPTGAFLDTSCIAGGNCSINWRPAYSDGKAAAYQIVLSCFFANSKIEKIIQITVRNKNRPPQISAIPEKRVLENETLVFNVESIDADQDSLTVLVFGLPDGAVFRSNIFTWKPIIGQAGNYSVKFTVYDREDSNAVTVLITAGNVAPPPAIDLEILSPSHDTVVNVSPIIVYYQINGVRFQKQVYLKSEINKITVDTTILGRTALDTLIVIYDTIPPNAPSVSGVTHTRSTSPVWNWKSGGGGNGAYRYQLDNQSAAGFFETGDTNYKSATDLAVSLHTLFVQERDPVGNWSQSGRWSIRIDTVPPNIPVISSMDGLLTNNRKPTWTWVSGGQGDLGLFQKNLDKAIFSNTDSSSFNIKFTPSSTLSDGTHTLYVREMDSAGNWSKVASFTLRVDATPPPPPSISIYPFSPMNTLNPTWKWGTESDNEASLFRYRLDFQDLSGAPGEVAWSFTPDVPLTEGPHTLYLQRCDSAGNWSATASRELVLALRGPLSNQGFSPARTDNLSMAINKAGVPYVAFRDGLSGYKAMVMYLNGMAWEPLGASGPSDDIVYSLSLALDSSGIPFVAYQDKAHGLKATVMKYNGSSWISLGSKGFGSGPADEIKLDVSKNGEPFIVFSDSSQDGKATAMRYQGNTWKNVGMPGFSAGSAFSFSLKLSSAGIPFVAFIDGAKNNRISVMKFNGTNWETVGNGGFSPGYVDFLSLGISSKEIPYVSFKDLAYEGKASVMKCSGSTWENVGSAGFSGGIIQETSLAFDKLDRPYIAFQDGTDNFTAVVMGFEASSWRPLSEGGLTTGAAANLSLIIGKNGVPLLGFSDQTLDGRASVIKVSFDP